MGGSSGKIAGNASNAGTLTGLLSEYGAHLSSKISSNTERFKNICLYLIPISVSKEWPF